MIKIIKSKKYAGYWVNGKYILPENFELSKNKLTEAEQQQFLKTTDQQQINNKSTTICNNKKLTFKKT